MKFVTFFLWLSEQVCLYRRQLEGGAGSSTLASWPRGASAWSFACASTSCAGLHGCRAFGALQLTSNLSLQFDTDVCIGTQQFADKTLLYMCIAVHIVFSEDHARHTQVKTERQLMLPTLTARTRAERFRCSLRQCSESGRCDCWLCMTMRGRAGEACRHHPRLLSYQAASVGGQGSD